MTELYDGNGKLSTIPTAVPPITDFPTPTAYATEKANPFEQGLSASLLKQATTARTGGDGQQPSPTPKPLPRQVNRMSTAPARGPRPVMPGHSNTTAGGLLRTMTSGIPGMGRRRQPITLHEDSSDDEAEKRSRRQKTIDLTYSKTEALSGHKSHEKSNVSRFGKKKQKKQEAYSQVGLRDKDNRSNKKDGRLTISVNAASNSGYLAKALNTSIKHHLLPGSVDAVVQAENEIDQQYKLLTEKVVEDDRQRPRLNIVIIVIGSRGDIQPFLKIGKILKNDYGHRVRIATHPAFKDFVENDIGLEFFSVGGNPSELMAFMVKNPGLIPSIDTVKSGEIGRRRSAMYEMFEGMWRACVNSVDDENDMENLKMMGAGSPFIADAIIANPPSFAHVHIAERLGIPLHMMFTFPYTPTTQFPHPLANIKQTDVDRSYTNFMSYPLVDLMTWQGLGDLVNKFRTKTLGLEPISTLWAPGQLYRFKVPYTYMWSPALVPKPLDWGPEIDIAGFVFLELASSFKPPESLTKFLAAGPPPVYIGFGSIVVDDPDRFTQMIFDAIKIAGVRALVSKGWGGIGGHEMDIPENIYLLDNTPHDWLFPQVSAVVHHGGAGTTAIGLKCGRPTMIVPFFGDQPFWGAMVAEKRAGAFECIPYKRLDAEKLAEGIKQCLTEEAKVNVAKIAESIANEGDGAENAVKSFHRSLHLRGPNSMRCFFLPNRVAVWELKGRLIRLSALAAEILIEQGKIRWSQLRLARHNEWNDFDGPGEPITGGSSALYHTITEASKGIGGLPHRATKVVKKRKRHQAKKQRAEEREKRLSAANEAEADAPKTEVAAVEGHTEAPALQVIDEDNRKDSKLVDTPEYEKENNLQTVAEHPAVGPSQQDIQLGEAPKTVEGDTLTVPKSSSKRGISQKDINLGDTPKSEGGETLHIQKTRPAAPVHNESTMTQASVLSAEPRNTLTEALAEETGHSLSRTGGALVKFPFALGLAVAQGFHNAPRLYGDPTVRRPRRIDGFHSGLRAGRDEFVYGLYDGVTGLVRLPYICGKERGFMGGVAGVGMGVGGLVLKPIAALVGPGAYISKGVEKEMKHSKSPIHFVKRARLVQGAKEMSALRIKELEDEQRNKEPATSPPPLVHTMSAATRKKEKHHRRKGKRHAMPEDDPATRVQSNPYKAHPGDAPLQDMIKHVLQDWQTYKAGRAFARAISRQGPLSRLAIHRERKRLFERGMFEDAEALAYGLQARWDGEDTIAMYDKRRESQVEKVKKGKAGGVMEKDEAVRTQDDAGTAALEKAKSQGSGLMRRAKTTMS